MNEENLNELERRMDEEFRRMVEAEGGGYEEAKWAVEDALSTPTPTDTLRDVVDFTYRVWVNARDSKTKDEETLRMLFGTFKKAVENLDERLRSERRSERREAIEKIREAREWPEFLD